MAQNDLQPLASLTFFEEVYNNTKDILDVLVQYIKLIIWEKKLYKFSLEDIQRELVDGFNSTIPSVIIRTACRRLESTNFIKGYPGGYELLLRMDRMKPDNYDKFVNIVKSSDEVIFNKLFKYLSEYDIVGHEIKHEFIAYITGLSEYKQEYKVYFNAFIVSKENDLIFLETINSIRDGAIIYKALSFEDINNLSSWSHELKIFFDTEILFSLMGFNGQIFENVTKELLELINEINLAHKNKIKMYYFDNVLTEINNFYSTAEEIVDQRRRLDTEKTAMKYIINGCKTKSDLAKKKVNFFDALRQYKINRFDDYNIYNSENHQHNIEAYQTDLKSLEIEATLNKIHIVRKGKTSTQSNLHAVLVSADVKTMETAKNQYTKNSNDGTYFHLAVWPDFIFGLLWLKARKKFSSGANINSFDILIKSKLALSSILKDDLHNKHLELKTKFENGEINNNEIIALLVEYTTRYELKPEDINSSNVKSIYDFITTDSINNYNNSIDNYEREISSLSKKLVEANTEKSQESQKVLHANIKAEKEKLNNYSLLLQIENAKRQKADSVFDCFKKVLKVSISISLIAIIIILVYPYTLMKFFGVQHISEYYSNICNVITIIPIVYLLILVIIFFLTERETSWVDRYVSLMSSLKKKIYQFYSVDNDKIKNIEKDLSNLNEYIKTLDESIN